MERALVGTIRARFPQADASAAGEAWSDGRIAEALDTSIDTIARTRQKRPASMSKMNRWPASPPLKPKS